MSNITTEALKSIDQIAAVRRVLRSQRDKTLFHIAINTGYRGGDLLALTVSDARRALMTGKFSIRQQKGDDVRVVTLDASAIESLEALLATRQKAKGDEPLFESAKAGVALSISSYSRLFKHWCFKAGLVGDFGSHTARKTFGYINSRVYGVPVERISASYGHSSEAVTRSYCGFSVEELAPLSMRGM